MKYRFMLKRDEDTNYYANELVSANGAQEAAYKAFEKFGNSVFCAGFGGALLYSIAGKENQLAKGIRL